MEHMAEDTGRCLKTLATLPTVIGTRCPLSLTADSRSVIEVLWSRFIFLGISVGLLHSETQCVSGEMGNGAIVVFVYERF